MVDIKQAVQIAKQYARELLSLTPESDLLLEETESDKQAFEITLSWPRRLPAQDLNPVSQMLSSNSHYSDRREFKTFRTLKSDGAVTKMTIREIA